MMGDAIRPHLYDAAAGTAALPSYTFLDDRDTGFYRAAANQLGVALGGAAKLLYSAGTFAFQEATNITTTSGALTITPLSGQSLNIVLGTTGDLVVNTNQLVVDTSLGRVGIGNTLPRAAIHVGLDVDYTDSSTITQLKLGGATDNSLILSLGYDTVKDYGFIQAVDEGVATKLLVLQPEGGLAVVIGKGQGGTTEGIGGALRAPSITTGGAGNIAGADLTIAAGLGTGTGDAGTIIFSLPIVAGAGDFIQTTATRLTLDMAGSTTLLSMVIAQDMTITGGNLLLGGTLGLTGTRVSNIFTTSQTTTNAETVDSWGATKQHITPYDDALAVLRGISVVAYEHKSVYDPSGRRKLGVLAESVGERMVTPFDEYVGLGQGPRLDMLGLAAINTRAIQQVDDEVETLRARVAFLESKLKFLEVSHAQDTD